GDTQVDAAPSEIGIGDRSVITAADDVRMSAESHPEAKAEAESKGGGAISGKVAETTTRVNFRTTATIGQDARIIAGDVIAIHATSNADTSTSSETYSVGIGAGADSDNTNDDEGVDLDVLTQAEIEPGPNRRGIAVDIDANAASINASARAVATSYSPILLGVATAFANARTEVTSDAKVI